MSHYTTIKVNLNASLVEKEIQGDEAFKRLTNESDYSYNPNKDMHRQIVSRASQSRLGPAGVSINKGRIALSGDADYLNALKTKLSMMQVTATLRQNPNYANVAATEDGLEAIDYAGNKTRIKFLPKGEVELEPLMQGNGCLSSTKNLEEKLGVVTSRKFKDPNTGSSVRLFV